MPASDRHFVTTAFDSSSANRWVESVLLPDLLLVLRDGDDVRRWLGLREVSDDSLRTPPGEQPPKFMS